MATATAVALPEPFVTLAEQQPGVQVSFSYREKWDAAASSNRGYPQVCTFVKKAWADANPETIARLNQELATAILTVQREPTAAAQPCSHAL